GVSIFNINLRYTKEAFPDKDLYLRGGVGIILFRSDTTGGYMPTNTNSSPGIDIEFGANHYFSKNYDSERDTKSGYYIKSFAGMSTSFASNISTTYPYIGTGIGTNYSNGLFGASLGIDIGTTLQTTPQTYFGGALFIRPELNIRFLF
ncbi:MAG: hypothetical protein ACK4IX_07365, partial [Candidatus Sericytochromatia bacterium]